MQRGVGMLMVYVVFLNQSEKHTLNNPTTNRMLLPITRANGVPVVSDVNNYLLQKAYMYDISSAYGLFRHMTGGIGGRPELEVYMTKIAPPHALSRDYSPLIFKYKPNFQDTKSKFNMPHQPRLDWQMWFAALSNHSQQVGWIWSFMFRVMSGSKDVWLLLDQDRTEFFGSTDGKTSPVAVKIRRHFFNFTGSAMSEEHIRIHNPQPGQEWYRRRSMRNTDDEWFSEITNDATHLMDWMKDNQFYGMKKVKSNRLVQKCMDVLFTYSHRLETEVMIWGVLLTTLLLRIVFTILKTRMQHIETDDKVKKE